MRNNPFKNRTEKENIPVEKNINNPVTLFLGGDVMTGRGIDQILPHPGNPSLHESYVRDARVYVRLAEEKNGPIPIPAKHDYIWGDALPEMERKNPHVRIINLETSITSSKRYRQEKDIHYRMNPDNIDSLKSARIDCSVLANNHVLDWDYEGLLDTIFTLRDSDIKTAGAGRDIASAAEPARLDTPTGRQVKIFAWAMTNAGVPPFWAAGETTPGINYLPDLSSTDMNYVLNNIRENSSSEDIVIFSIHWGSNWGYQIPKDHVRFARRLIDEGAVDIVYGHSSHHVRPLEVYRNKLILYGCGDFLNDYEGISGYERFPKDLALLYFPTLNASDGELQVLEIVPMQIRKMRLNQAAEKNSTEITEILNRECADFGTRISQRNGRLFVD